jgi:hypothetical protein
MKNAKAIFLHNVGIGLFPGFIVALFMSGILGINGEGILPWKFYGIIDLITVACISLTIGAKETLNAIKLHRRMNW